MAAIAPGAWLGLLGGGQLGRMFCMAAQSLGYRVVVLDPGAESPAGSVADRHLAADYLDAQGLAQLAALAAGATTEFENVPAAALDFLARTARVTPTAASVAIAQDRISEKMFLSGHALPVAPFAVLRGEDDVTSLKPGLLPGIVKSARLGYDGKGQYRVRTIDAVRDAMAAMRGQPCVLEALIPLEREVSVIVARDDHGHAVTWPVAENLHRDGILDVSIVPARVTPALAGQARAIATSVALRLDYRGVLCVEMFVTTDGALLVNEIAPRPHNSGHYTIDACDQSQFDLQVRTLAGLPLVQPRQHSPAIMLNLLGDLWLQHAPAAPDWAAALALPGVHLHLYGKLSARAGRKMGHLTVTAASVDQVRATAKQAAAVLGLPAP